MSGEVWQRCRNLFFHDEKSGLALDISRVRWPGDYLESMAEAAAGALTAMAALEKGALANPDEKRQVGHYWLRAPELAPEATITAQIRDGVAAVKQFAADVHAGRLRPPHATRFRRFLLIGIGGSALGPQLMNDAFAGPGDPMTAYFFDNTDPDGFDRTLVELGPELGSTLTLVITKSGGTPETRNGMLEAARAYEAASLSFRRHAVAITGVDSPLHRQARERRWLRSFPMYDWIGGRTSQTSVVGLLPAALSGFDIDGFLDGARHMDQLTRATDLRRNPAALLALSWYHLTDGRGAKDMVILPYKDRLQTLSRYLQQLVMESLGKKHDLEGNLVHQGIAVYGNKGSTDQHAYVQQLRDGVDNFFVTFLQVLEERAGEPVEVESGITAGDYLAGFLLGTREALHEAGRDSLTISLDRLDEISMGAVIALFERAVGLYATLINVNAYHQPGVEAGKKAAAQVIALQKKIVEHLGGHPDQWLTTEAVAAAVDAGESLDTVFEILRRLAVAGGRGVQMRQGDRDVDASFSAA